MSNPIPPDGTKSDTLHWLYRDTGAPHWMVATWTGDRWVNPSGMFRRPVELVWWRYRGPAFPPDARYAVVPVEVTPAMDAAWGRAPANVAPDADDLRDDWRVLVAAGRIDREPSQ